MPGGSGQGKQGDQVTAIACADVSVRLSAWIDGELGTSEAAEVREHLTGCVSCQRRHALLVAASSAVRSLPAETVSAGFEDAFRRRLAAARTGGGNPRRLSTVAIATVGLAAVLVLTALGLLVSRQTPTPRVVPRAKLNEVPQWLTACGARTAAECQLDTPCASATACGVGALHGMPAVGQAPVVVVQLGEPCASFADCGVVSAERWKLPAGHGPPARRVARP
jgi:anti-sigma factor RsiW